ncbi:MAG: LacI family DNA-binding transcriptional regulator [Tepidisphaeraceae bacterium]
MTIARVAALAGVSPSTVSRVLNEHPSVTADTARNVRQAMATLQFDGSSARSRVVRRSVSSTVPQASRTGSVAFLMFGNSRSHPSPGFQRLLCGVSSGVEARGLRLIFSYVSSIHDLPTPVSSGGVDGLLLHGSAPDAELLAKLGDLPTVWLMANRQRPVGSDQVMPDNVAIGDLAGRHLVQRGHKSVAYMGIAGWSWSFGVRAIAFEHLVRERQCDVSILEEQLPFADDTAGDYWGGDLDAVASRLVDRMLALPARPTGLFIGEDRLLPVVTQELARRGIDIGAIDGQAGVDRDRRLQQRRASRRAHRQLAAHRRDRPATGIDRPSRRRTPALARPQSRPRRTSAHPRRAGVCGPDVRGRCQRPWSVAETATRPSLRSAFA